MLDGNFQFVAVVPVWVEMVFRLSMIERMLWTAQ
jgi:hypothetical protein